MARSLIDILDDIENEILRASEEALRDAADNILRRMNEIKTEAVRLYYESYAPKKYKKRQHQLVRGLYPHVEITGSGWDLMIRGMDDGTGFSGMPSGTDSDDLAMSAGYRAYEHTWNNGKHYDNLHSEKYEDDYERGPGVRYPEWLERYIERSFLTGVHPNALWANTPNIKQYLDKELSAVMNYEYEKFVDEVMNRL